VLGGGLVAGSLTLIAGEPGIGKSTLILQAAARLASSTGAVLYVSGEESEEQIRLRADRVTIPASVPAPSGPSATRSENASETITQCPPETAGQSYGEDNLIPENLYILSETNIENIIGSVSDL
jgi:predicted ATP-dependent serine protease